MKLVKQAMAWFKQADTAPLHRNYVISETFSDIANCFDAEAIWGRPRMVIGEQRLRSLLNEYRFTVGGSPKVFENVIVELPAMNVEHDRRISRGDQTNCMSLATELAEMHRNAFGKLLPEGESPRYRVIPALDLDDDQVRIRFGHGVYIPRADEPILWQIETSRDGTIFPKHEGSIALPAQQHLCVLGGSSNAVSLTCPGWPFSNDVSLVIVNDPSQEQLSITAEPLDKLSIRHDEKLNSYVIGLPNSAQPSPDAPVYYVRATRQTPVPQKSELSGNTPAVIRKRGTLALSTMLSQTGDETHQSRLEPKLDSQHAMQATGDLTHVANKVIESKQSTDNLSPPTMLPQRPTSRTTVPNDATWLVPKALIRGGRLHLAGIALQRPSGYSAYGINALSIGFDANGQVVPPNSEQWQVRISVNTNDVVNIETRQGQRPLALGETIPLSGQHSIQFDNLPNTLSDRYIGYLRIPESSSQDLIDGSEFRVSRDPAQSNFSRLQVLNGRGFISATQDPGGDCMGISSRQCNLRLENDRLHVACEGQAPMFVLDTELRNPMPVGNQDAITLASQQYLLLGHYMWRFERIPKAAGIAKIGE